MKKFLHRIRCGQIYFGLGLHPIAMTRFLKDPEAQEWCDRLYNLIHNETEVSDS